MDYDFFAKINSLVLGASVYDCIKKEKPDLLSRKYKSRVIDEFKEILGRTEGLGGQRHNPMEGILVFGAYLLAVYKATDGEMSEELFKKCVDSISNSTIIKLKGKTGNMFSQKTVAEQRRLERLGKEESYKNVWEIDFDYVDGSGECYITYTKCGLCSLGKQEGLSHLIKYLCGIDYAIFKHQGLVLDRTKTLAYGDEHCNFHIMTQEKAEEIGFKKSKDSK